MLIYQIREIMIFGVVGFLCFILVALGNTACGESATVVKIKELAAGGDVIAQSLLGDMYRLRVAIPYDRENLQQAHFWHKEAAEQGYFWAQFVFFPENERERQEKFSWEKEAAEQGNLLAQISMGEEYLKGRDTSQDYQEAFYWFKKAAEQESRYAQSMVGVLSYEGRGTLQDYQEAFYWFKKAAEQGDMLAQVGLSVMYLNGQGVQQDYQQSLYWSDKAARDRVINQEEPVYASWGETTGGFEDAAKQDHMFAQSGLGLMYYYKARAAQQGSDNKGALFYFKKAAEQGFTPAKYEIGRLYNFGTDPTSPALKILDAIPRDDQQAVYWYKEAAEQGDAGAQFRLGEISMQSGDDKEAFYWFKKAAEQGNFHAQIGLGAIYYAGQVVPKDDKQAIYWYENWQETFYLGLDGDRRALSFYLYEWAK